jgi:hypothetical protein
MLLLLEQQVLLGYCIGAVLNGVIVTQIMVYGSKPEKKTKAT